jgi:hypothetical protein
MTFAEDSYWHETDIPPWRSVSVAGVTAEIAFEDREVAIVTKTYCRQLVLVDDNLENVTPNYPNGWYVDFSDRFSIDARLHATRPQPDAVVRCGWRFGAETATMDSFELIATF